MTKKAALKKAIKQAGGITALAAKLGTSKQNVSNWDIAPPHWCLSIERETGISRYELRPDVYGAP